MQTKRQVSFAKLPASAGMDYEGALGVLIEQLCDLHKAGKLETVAEYLLILLNAVSSKPPALELAQNLIDVVNKFLFDLINAKTVHPLQALEWVEKASRLASSLSLSKEKAQLKQLQEQLHEVFDASALALLAQEITNVPLEQTAQTTLRELNKTYKKYFDLMIQLLTGRLLSSQEVRDLVKALKTFIFKSHQEANTQEILNQAILLCQAHQLVEEASELSTLMHYWYPATLPSPRVQPSNRLSLQNPNSAEPEAEAIQLHLQATAIIQKMAKEIAPSDPLLDKCIIHLLTLATTQVANTQFLAKTLDLMYEIIQGFLVNQDIGLAYHSLEEVILLAEKLDCPEQRNQFALAQGDLLAKASGQQSSRQKEVAAVDIQNLLKSLNNYFDVYFIANIKGNVTQLREVETKITTLETRILYYESKPWLIQRLSNAGSDLSSFKKTFTVINEMGQRLLACGEFDLAWCFYASMQPLLTNLTKDWHAEILIQLAQIGRLKCDPTCKQYSLKGDWQRYREDLASYRQELKLNSLKYTSFTSRQKYYTKSVMRLIAVWLKEAEDLLGKAPDSYALLGLGSMSRWTLAPYSDLECVFLTAKAESSAWDELASENARYFSALYRLFELKAACLGELRGFRLDKEGHPRVEGRLRGTPEGVLSKNHPRTLGVLKDDEMTYSLLNPVFLYGDSTLFQEYQKLLGKELEKPCSKKEPRLWKDVLATAYLPLHSKYFEAHNPLLVNSNALSSNGINIKKDYVAPLMYVIADICLYYRIRYTNTSDVLTQLQKAGKLASIFEKALRCAVEVADEIRMQLHLFYGEQNDVAMPYGVLKEGYLTLTQKQQQNLDLIAWGLIRPLQFILASLQKGEAAPLFDPFHTMIQQAEVFKDILELDYAMQSMLFALALTQADIDDYRLAYLPLSPKSRDIFQSQLPLLEPFIQKDKIAAIKQVCYDCPLPNGIRQSQQAKEKAWNYLLTFLISKENFQASKKKNSIMLHWINSADEEFSGELHPQVMQYLTNYGYFKNGKLQITQEKIDESDGRHMVIPLDLTVDSQLLQVHLKCFPEMPGMECAAGELARLLAGFGTPFTQLIRMTVDDKVIPILVSQTVIGTPMHIMIKEKGDELNNLLEPRRFHQRAFLALLLNQEDAKPSNFILEKNASGQYEMVCVDNDRSFFPAIIEEDSRIVPVVKEITYCFELMEQQIDPVVAAEILHLDAFALLNTWIDKLEKVSEVTNRLFTMDEMQALFPKKGQAKFQQQLLKHFSSQNTINETILPITLSEYTLANLYIKLTRLQAYLTDSAFNERSLSALLLHIEPYLAKYYQKLLKEFPNIKERFQCGFAELYGEKQEKTGAYQTKKTAFASLQTLHGKPKDAKAILETKDQTLDIARRELKDTYSAQKHWGTIYETLMQGSPTACQALATLPDRHLRETIINKIDFGQLLTKEYQQQVLTTITQMQTPFRVLRLTNCDINDEQLAQILSSALELEFLVLDNCRFLTERSIMSIAKCCPILVKLTLNRLQLKSIDSGSLAIPQLFTPAGSRSTVVFSELQFLDVSDCMELNKLYIAAPKLTHLYARNCSVLKEGKLQSKALRNLDLQNCSALTTEELSKFVTHFPYLQSVVLEGCERIESRAHYVKFPYLLRIDLSVLTSEYTQGLIYLLEKFQAKSKNAEQVGKLLEKLHQHFNEITRWIPLLTQSLNDASSDVQQAAILAIQQMGRKDFAIMNQLKQLALSTSPILRAAASVAIYNLGVKEQKISLQDVFSSHDHSLLKNAISGLNLLGSEAKTEAIFLNVLEKGYHLQRKAVLDTFADWPYASKDIIQSLKDIILNPTDTQQAAAFFAYWLLQKKHKLEGSLQALVASQKDYFLENLPKWLAVCTKTEPATCLEIRKAFMSIDARLVVPQEAQNFIKELENASNWEKRKAAIQYIGEHQIQSEGVLERLLHLLKSDVYYNVREVAACAIGYLGIKEERIDRELTQALNDRDFHVVAAVVKTFSYLGVRREDTKRRLVTLLTDEHLEIREGALTALATFKEFDEEVITAVMNNQMDKYTDIKCAAIKALVHLLSLDILETTLIKSLKVPEVLQPQPTKTRALLAQSLPKMPLSRSNSDSPSFVRSRIPSKAIANQRSFLSQRASQGAQVRRHDDPLFQPQRQTIDAASASTSMSAAPQLSEGRGRGQIEGRGQFPQRGRFPARGRGFTQPLVQSQSSPTRLISPEGTASLSKR